MSIVGLVFTIIGAIFLVLGIALGIGLKSELGMESFVFLFTFGGMGSLFFTLGLVFLITLGNQKKNAQRLLDNGNYVVAEIFDISQNYNVSVNGRHPFAASVSTSFIILSIAVNCFSLMRMTSSIEALSAVSMPAQIA